MTRLTLGLTALILTLSGAAHASVDAKAWLGASGSSVHKQNVQQSKRDVLARLKTLQDQQLASSTEIDAAIRKQLQETLTMEIKNDDLNVASRRTGLLTKKIDELNSRRNELNARRELVDRLIFQVDSKFTNQNLQTFLEQTFIEMASTDLADGRDSRIWKALTYLSMVMREVPEPNEDSLSIFEGYLNASSLLDPKTPADFIASRNYTNGSESAVARQSVPALQTSPAPVPALRREVQVRTTIARETTTPKTTIVLGPTPPPPTATAPPTPIKAARDAAVMNPPNTLSGTSQSARELTAPASESQLH